MAKRLGFFLLLLAIMAASLAMIHSDEPSLTAGALLLFMGVNGLLLTNGALLLGIIDPRQDPFEGYLQFIHYCIQLAIICFVLIVAVTVALGLFGGITVEAVVLVQTGLLVLLAMIAKGRKIPSLHSPASVPGGMERTGESQFPLWARLNDYLTLSAFFLVVSLCASLLVFGLETRPYAYDALTYHLFFPAKWLQNHAIEIIPTPFGDNAPAYSPSNGELFFLWLMLPFHSDILARAGQFPFAVLGCLCLYRLAHLLGASKRAALYPVLFLLLSRPYLHQTILPYVDIVFASAFTASVYFIVRCSYQRRRADALFAGLAAGLSVGSKYAALVYMPCLLLLFLFSIYPGSSRTDGGDKGPAPPSAPALGFLFLGGLAFPGIFWYARNLLQTGSLIYPGSLEVFGKVIMEGAYGREAMLESPFHLQGPELFFRTLGQAYGTKLFFLVLAASLAAVTITIAKRRFFPHGLLVIMPVLMALLYWKAIPYNSQYRLFFPGVALSTLSFGCLSAFLEENKQNAFVRLLRFVLHSAFAVLIIWLVAGDQGLINRDLRGLFLALSAFLALLAAAVHRTISRARFLHGYASLATQFRGFCFVSVFCLLIFIIPAAMRLQGKGAAYPATGIKAPAFLKLMGEGWNFMDSIGEPVGIAYAGNNLPYRLMGDDLRNAVEYVNVNRFRDWKFHDFDLAVRRGGDFFPAVQHAPKPAYYRMQPNFKDWLNNLRHHQIDYLFVSSLTPYEAEYIDHDKEGFPLERAWAESRPDIFRPVFESRAVRIFQVRKKSR